MDIDKIHKVTHTVAEEVIHEYTTITYESIVDTISKAVTAAFEEYEKQK